MSAGDGDQQNTNSSANLGQQHQKRVTQLYGYDRKMTVTDVEIPQGINRKTITFFRCFMDEKRRK
jgi:hypothetical protein